jgi:hypothetical protein
MRAVGGCPPATVQAMQVRVRCCAPSQQPYYKMQARIAELGGVPMPMSPAEFGKLVADETEKWGAVVKAAGISVE